MCRLKCCASVKWSMMRPCESACQHHLKGNNGARAHHHQGDQKEEAELILVCTLQYKNTGQEKG